jgi:hypothetical protein
MATTMADLKPISGRWYTASFHAPSRQIRIVAKKPLSKSFYMFVPIVSACDQPGKRDVHVGLSDFQVKKRGQTTVLTFTEKSALWDRKEYTIEFGPQRIKYYYKVFGKGEVSRAYFFRSWMKDPITVEEELGVVPGYDMVFSPAVNFEGKVYHFAGDTSIITVGNDPMYWGSGLVCAPFCFGLRDHGDKMWAWAGLGVRAGQYTFEEFTYNSNETKRIFGAGGFDCNYNGKLSIDGSWESPHIILGASDGPYRAQKDYVGVLESEYGLTLQRKRKMPLWWRSPIFCGWGEQMSLAFRDSGNLGTGPGANTYCTQALHDEWMEIMRKHDIHPGQIIIDAGWEKPGATGDMYVDEGRWPDLRGWIEARRKEGIRTILWMCAWNRDGVPDEECVKDKDGKVVNVDPTNPAYEKRLRAMVRRMISDEPGCYGGDGVKIDGELSCPIGPGLVNHENVWGLELQRRYMQIVHDEAKKHKPDALVGTFMANPYMADLSDVVRTADMFGIKGSPKDVMVHRGKIISIAMPGCPIDTDHTFWYDQTDNWIDIMPAMLEVGIPCLYHADYVWHKRPFTWTYMERMTDEHYAVVSKVFKQYWKRLKR